MNAEDLTEDDIEQVIIAGAFDTFIELISKSQRAMAQQIAQQDGYIELAAVPNFNCRFAEAAYA